MNGILVIIVIALVITLTTERIMRRRYWLRACTGTDWKKRFPDASKDEIRGFLEEFVKAFGFSRKKRLKFSPDDKVMEVYESLYPPLLQGVDSCELEGFAINLENKYGLNLNKIWRPDITLGEIFETTRK